MAWRVRDAAGGRRRAARGGRKLEDGVSLEGRR